MKHGGLFQFLFAVAAAALAYVASELHRKHWYNVGTVSFDDFRSSAELHELPVPTTYYTPGKIQDTLPGWQAGFKLYRVAENSSYEFDFEEIDSKLRVNVLKDKEACSRSLGALFTCPSCCLDRRKPMEIVEAADVLNRKVRAYGSFSKLDMSAVEYLWSTMNLPFSVDDSQLEHAFLSNLEDGMVTASLHANPMTESMSIQFEGHKTWMFFKDEDYIGEHGFGATCASPISLPKHAPNAPLDYYMYTSQPGDILFFPPNYAHIVYTHPGPNVMVNFRKAYAQQIVRTFVKSPLSMMMATVNMAFFGQYDNKRISDETVETASVGGKAFQTASMPEKVLNMWVMERYWPLCEDTSSFDRKLNQLISEAGEKYDAESASRK